MPAAVTLSQPEPNTFAVPLMSQANSCDLKGGVCWHEVDVGMLFLTQGRCGAGHGVGQPIQ